MPSNVLRSPMLRKRPRLNDLETQISDEEEGSSTTGHEGDSNFSDKISFSTRLPNDVSDWSLLDLDKLAIFYDKSAKSAPSDVLQIVTGKTGDYGELTSEQNEILTILTDYLDFDLRIEKEKLKRKQYLEGIIQHLRLVAENVQRQMNSESNPSPTKSVVCNYALDFLKEVSRVVYKMAHSNNLGSGTIPEEFYSSLTSSFARLCQLYPVQGMLYKTRLRIDGVNVTSIPDLVLEKNSDFPSVSSVVSIKEAKKDAVLPEPGRKKEVGGSEKSQVQIQQWLSDKVLGQHGGELLLAWNSSETEYVPGMIVVGTKIYLTLLHISSDHVGFLGPGIADSNEVEKYRATIIYSEPKDIFVKEERNILIQTVMRLNNENTLI